MLLFVLNIFIDEFIHAPPNKDLTWNLKKGRFGNRITHTHHEFNSNDSYPRFVSKGTWWSYEAVWWTCLEKSSVERCSDVFNMSTRLGFLLDIHWSFVEEVM